MLPVLTLLFESNCFVEPLSHEVVLSLVFAPGIVLKGYNIISIVIHFLNFTSKSKITKAKISQQDYIKLRNFCTAKESIHQQNDRQPTEWEKIVANYTSRKGLTSKIYKKLTQLNRKTQSIWLKNGQKNWRDNFPKKTYR